MLSGLILLLALLAFSVAAGEECNDNGVSDDLDIGAEKSTDCNTNSVPDECDTAIAFVQETIDTGFVAEAVSSDLDGDGDTDVLVSMIQAIFVGCYTRR